MKFSFLRCAVLVGSLAIASVPALADNLIVNGGFETGDFSGWVNNTSTSYVKQGPFDGFQPNSGTYFAALGDQSSDGSLSQTFTDTAGGAYTLSFYLGSDGDIPNDFSVLINTDELLSLTDISSTGSSYGLYSYSFTGTGSDTLTINERNDDGFLALNDVSVALNSSVVPTPEPSSLLLLGTGVLVAAEAFRRRLIKA